MLNAVAGCIFLVEEHQCLGWAYEYLCWWATIKKEMVMQKGVAVCGERKALVNVRL